MLKIMSFMVERCLFAFQVLFENSKEIFRALPVAVFSVSFADVWPLIPSAISSTPSTRRAKWICGCVRRGKKYIQLMVATDMIEQIRQLPNREAVRLYDYLFSEAGELDRLLAAFDRLPRKTRLTEKEILNLPRARPTRQ
jgi:hypothetical protein